MNEINAQQRLREANSHKADAEKILLVKAAEAESESRHMTGVGIARQRKALVDGLSDTVAQYTSEVQGTTPKDVMDLLLLTQYFGEWELVLVLVLVNEWLNGGGVVIVPCVCAGLWCPVP
jgi:hypothetical protein